MPVECYIPGQAVDDLKSKFDKLNACVMALGGFVVSVHGAAEVTIECLPESSIPDELLAAGYDVVPADPPQGERILAHAITQKLTLSSCGIFEELVEGSTKQLAEVRTHAGICKVLRYALWLE